MTGRETSHGISDELRRPQRARSGWAERAQGGLSVGGTEMVPSSIWKWRAGGGQGGFGELRPQ